MIAVFARSNHPHGFGYTCPGDPIVPYFTLGAHGYSIVAVKCNSIKQRDKVVLHICREGFDLPDGGRKIYVDEEKPKYRSIGTKGIMRWYSGGPGDWDYLFTVKGNALEWPSYYTHDWQSRGDNRFVGIYDAKTVLSE